MSELLVGAVEHTAHVLGLTEVFVGVILVAIIGNAAEHSTAVLVAMKNHMELAINIAVGSSAQVAMFVAPVLVFLSYLFGEPMEAPVHQVRGGGCRALSMGAQPHGAGRRVTLDGRRAALGTVSYSRGGILFSAGIVAVDSSVAHPVGF